MRARNRKLLYSLLALAAVLLWRALSPSPAHNESPSWEGESNPRTVLVEYCYDGDSLRAAGGLEVRVIGIDSPERGQPFAAEARAYAKAALEGKSVTLEPDRGVFTRDRYDRLLAYVRVDGEDYGPLLLRRGLARIYPFAPFERKEAYMALEDEARRDHAGMWGR
ncbi:MAG: thermonuclease family protein [Planctomycetota bacterium]